MDDRQPSPGNVSIDRIMRLCSRMLATIIVMLFGSAIFFGAAYAALGGVVSGLIIILLIGAIQYPAYYLLGFRLRTPAQADDTPHRRPPSPKEANQPQDP